LAQAPATRAASRRWGGEQRPDGEADDGRDQAERGGFDREHGGDLARGQANGLQQPDLAVLRGGAGTDEDRDDREDDDQEHDRVGREDDPLPVAQAPRRADLAKSGRQRLQVAATPRLSFAADPMGARARTSDHHRSREPAPRAAGSATPLTRYPFLPSASNG
jgi:hypothetical protein